MKLKQEQKQSEDRIVPNNKKNEQKNLGPKKAENVIGIHKTNIWNLKFTPRAARWTRFWTSSTRLFSTPSQNSGTNSKSATPSIWPSSRPSTATCARCSSWRRHARRKWSIQARKQRAQTRSRRAYGLFKFFETVSWRARAPVTAGTARATSRVVCTQSNKPTAHTRKCESATRKAASELTSKPRFRSTIITTGESLSMSSLRRRPMCLCTREYCFSGSDTNATFQTQRFRLLPPPITKGDKHVLAK